MLSTTTVVNSEAYTKAQNIKDGSSIEHFFEKLLRLKDMMLTKHGKALAEKRHTFMVTYIRELAMEISGHDGDALLKGKSSIMSFHYQCLSRIKINSLMMF